MTGFTASEEHVVWGMLPQPQLWEWFAGETCWMR